MMRTWNGGRGGNEFRAADTVVCEDVLVIDGPALRRSVSPSVIDLLDDGTWLRRRRHAARWTSALITVDPAAGTQ
jgi:hypothetical protein